MNYKEINKRLKWINKYDRKEVLKINRIFLEKNLETEDFSGNDAFDLYNVVKKWKNFNPLICMETEDKLIIILLSNFFQY